MKSDLKDCSCWISQMRQVGVGVVKGQETRGAGWVFFCSLLTKPEGISNKMGEKRGISNEPAEMCLVCMGIGSQQRDPGAAAEPGVAGGDPVQDEQGFGCWFGLQVPDLGMAQCGVASSLLQGGLLPLPWGLLLFLRFFLSDSVPAAAQGAGEVWYLIMT
mgnify:CR=1 FL=1